MPICEHGHEHNVFVTEGEPHNCKTCGVCAYLEENSLESKKNNLFDALIDIVEQHLYVDGLTESQARNGNAQAYVPKDELEKCKEEMSNEILKWTKDLFQKPDAADGED
jgi:uncharacterized protein YggL (DUF469 family)